MKVIDFTCKLNTVSFGAIRGNAAQSTYIGLGVVGLTFTAHIVTLYFVSSFLF